MRSRQILGFHFRKLIITHIFHKPEFACRFHSVWVGRAVLDFYEDPLVVSVFGKALGGGGGLSNGENWPPNKKNYNPWYNRAFQIVEYMRKVYQ